MKLLVLATLVVCATAYGHRRANEHAIINQLEHTFRRMDRNHDGTLTPDETDAYIAAMDTNGDGRISYDEFNVAREEGEHGPLHATEEESRLTFKYYDTRGGTQPADDYIVREDSVYFFSFFDLNGDGLITVQEFDQSMLKFLELLVILKNTQ